MELAEQIVMQLMQPTFYYATVLMIIGSACSALLLKINKNISPGMRSVLLIVPLIGSLVILLIFIPSLSGWGFLEGFHPLIQGVVPGGTLYGAPSPWAPLGGPDGILPITSLLMALGVGLGLVSLVLSTVFAQVITRRLLGVVDMGPEDFPALRRDIRDLTARLGVPEPRLALIEDLRPNAFTFGRGKHATVVFSLGMLTLLDDSELRAVAAHELAHIKNRDVRFKSASRSLAWTFFYNPAAHLSARAAQRERERLADETARSVLEEKGSLIRAIEKVSRIVALTPRPTLASRLGLRMTLSLSEHTSLLSDHPSLADRIGDFRPRAPSYLSPAAGVALSLGVLVAAVLLMASIGEVRTEILHSVLDPVPLQMPSLAPLEQHLLGTPVSWPGPTPFHPVDRDPFSGQEYVRMYGKVLI